MISLPLSRVWTGDGFGQNDAVTHTQLKRNEHVALYSVTNKHGVLKGYEVFYIKKRLKGQPLPGGIVEAEDREVYPSANGFGKIAWSIRSLDYAEKRFQEMTDLANGIIPEKVIIEKKPKPVKVKKTITVPVGEFTVKELAEKNSVPNHIAAMFIKEFLNKTIGFVREARLHKIGKASKFYKSLSVK